MKRKIGSPMVSVCPSNLENPLRKETKKSTQMARLNAVGRHLVQSTRVHIQTSFSVRTRFCFLCVPPRFSLFRTRNDHSYVKLVHSLRHIYIFIKKYWRSTDAGVLGWAARNSKLIARVGISSRRWAFVDKKSNNASHQTRVVRYDLRSTS